MRKLQSLALLFVLGITGVLGVLPTQSASAQATGAFYTQNSKIYDPYGREFIPVGANLLGPNDDTPWPNALFGMYDFEGDTGEIDALGMSDEVVAWNWNTVRLNICQDKYCTDKTTRIYTNPDFVARMDAIVEEYTSKRIVVMPELHELMGDMQTSAERDALLDFWEWAADRYKDNSYVWFNIANEPGPDPTPGDYTIWQDLHSDAIDRIRGEGADNLIVIDGTWFGQDRDWGSSENLCEELPVNESAVLGHSAPVLTGNTNVVFSLHVYQMWGLDECTAQQHQDRLTEYVTGVRALGAPIIIGEVGFELNQVNSIPDNNPVQAAERMAATEALYTIAESLDLGVLVWGAQDANGQDSSPYYDGSFSLVQSGSFYNLGTGQSNLSAFGQLHWDYSQVMGVSITIPDESGGGGSESPQGSNGLADTGLENYLLPAIALCVLLFATGVVLSPSTRKFRDISRQ